MLNEFILGKIEDGTAPNLKYTSADPNAASWTDYIVPVVWIGLLILLGVLMFRRLPSKTTVIWISEDPVQRQFTT